MVHGEDELIDCFYIMDWEQVTHTIALKPILMLRQYTALDEQCNLPYPVSILRKPGREKILMFIKSIAFKK